MEMLEDHKEFKEIPWEVDLEEKILLILLAFWMVTEA